MLATPQGYTEYLPLGNNSARSLRWADKAVADSIPYTLDCTDFLNDAGGDTIDPTTVTIAPSPNDPPTLIIGASQFTGTTLTWQISGGMVTNPIADYAIIVQFSTVGGITIERPIWLRVWPLSPNRTFATDLVVIEGPPGPPGPAFTQAQFVAALQALSQGQLQALMAALIGALQIGPGGLSGGSAYNDGGVPVLIPPTT